MFSSAVVIVVGLSVVGDNTRAQTVTNSTYAAVPPFVGGTNSIPNVLFLLDNSGSMDDRACKDPSPCGVLADGTPATTNDFTPTTKYSGYFNQLKCYDYDGTNRRFTEASTKAALIDTCGGSRWDGNLLNWISFRRFDAAKLAMIGGDCVVARAVDGTCPPTGSPAMKTVGVQTKFSSSSAGHETDSIPAAIYTGRMPNSVATGGGVPFPDPIYFHLRGGLPSGSGGLAGNFCVDDDSNAPASTAGSCVEGDAFQEGVFQLYLGLGTEPTGVLQQVGNQARFGLAVFSTDNAGSRVLVGLGARQAIDFNASTVETFNTNVAAMVDGIQETFPTTWTPLSEALYESVRYVAQINSALHPTTYEYPLAFSPGVGFQSSGVGGIGSAEITALTGAETCPAGYISNACGRDPYFFGSNHTPMWASPSSVVTCCQTFILVFTDGAPTQDLSVPSALQDYAHAVHGMHCTGGSGTIHAPDGTCNTNNATPPSTLLGEHKTDYGSNGAHYLDDVAYWAHTVDLRQATIPVLNVAGHDLPGMQNVTIYTFFAFGNIAGREILMQTAKMGGFEDINSNGIPESGEYDKINNVTGASGADGIPDTYFESNDVDDMKDKLIAVLSSILQRSTSGTSLSVLATSTTGEGALYQSFFFPKVTEGLTNVYWIGYTQALFLDTFGNLREDSNGDGRLVYKDDKILRTRYESATGEVKADLFVDTSPSPDGDGVADTPSTPSSTVALKDIKPIWESGKKLAERDTTTTPRKIFTWLDLDNDGVVDTSEQLDFKAASPDNSARIQPYIRAATSTEAVNIINWIRGEMVTGYRNRELTVGGTLKTWRYGDTIHSTPTVVGAPRERFDVLYGDISYSAFFQAYKDRRQVSYVGANDGMLHAFNVGFYNAGDDPSTTTSVEHGWFTTQKIAAPFVSNTPALGHELWAFIPQELLPQLKFLTEGDYQHVYYVDQKSKITDARIFCDGSAGAPTSPNCVTGQGTGSSHPNGWGTILIGAYRLGGSCANCSTGATDLSVTADFNYDGDTSDPGDTRTFRSAYFVLDITDPELDPKLLMVFTDPGLGLTLGYPAGVRLRPAGGDKTQNSDARWFMVFGSGPTGYDVGSVQTGKFYVVDLVKYAAARTLNSTYYVFDTPNTCGAAAPNSECSVIGPPVTVDTDFDYRADILYFGNIICNATSAPCNGNMGSGSPPAPTWRGRLYRLTTGSSTNPALGTETDPCGWGIGAASCVRTPSILLNDFACTGACVGATRVGPVSMSPNVAQDDSNKIWVYWGTGRYFSSADKINADAQHFFGVKDMVPTSGCTQTATPTSCEEKDLVDVSNAEICVIGTTTGSGTCQPNNQVTGVTGADGYDTSSGTANTLQGLMQSKDGWFTTLPDTRERALSSPAIIGGLVFFPTYVPTNDICSASGSSFLYALYYKSGTAYKESVIGTEVSGANTNVKRRTGITDPGMASGVAVHIGAQGSGANGSGGGGCQGQLTANIQSSTGSVGQTCIKTAGAPWSYYVSWVSQRE
jgi:type IV pilus assembly protein PilY1